MDIDPVDIKPVGIDPVDARSGAFPGWGRQQA